MFEIVLRRRIEERLVGGEGFAVDASLIKADANRQKEIEGDKGLPPEAAGRVIDEYLAVLDDAAFGAATEVPWAAVSQLSRMPVSIAIAIPRDFKIVDSFDELRQMKCIDQALRGDIIYPISGDVGVYEVVRTSIKLQQIANPKSGEVVTFGDTLVFTTTLTGGVQPKLVVGPLNDRFRPASADGDFSASLTDVHTVTLALAGSLIKANKPAGV